MRVAADQCCCRLHRHTDVLDERFSHHLSSALPKTSNSGSVIVSNRSVQRVRGTFSHPPGFPSSLRPSPAGAGHSNPNLLAG